MTFRRVYYVSLWVLFALLTLLGFLSGPVARATDCGAQTYTWAGYSKINREHPTFDVPLVLPAGTVVSFTASTYDGYSPGAVPSRFDQDQKAEQALFGIGDVTIRAFTPDLPDVDNYSGLITVELADWAGVQVSGGPVRAYHASLAGVTDGTPSSLTVGAVSIVLQTCTTTTTTTQPPVTTTVTTASTATTQPASGGGGGNTGSLSTSELAAIAAAIAGLGGPIGMVGYQFKRRNDHDLGEAA